ncbi:HAMP domain-containing protein [Actinokineospora sp.]|uniref:HAMP domain-containing protein n=1 Tax=Actinokineospora sp. TaxID=1872133 RepID=UPI003D6A8AB9
MSRRNTAARLDQARRLESQIPESGFPSGIAIPSLCVLVLLLALAALSASLLDDRTAGSVPRAFVDTQQRLAADTARAVGASASQSVSDLRLAAAVQTDSAETLLDKLIQNPRWRGAAVLSGSERTQLATRGEQVPVQAVPAHVTDVALSSIVAGTGELQLVTTLALPGDLLLTATTSIKLPPAEADPALGQSLHLTTLNGQIVGVSRAPNVPENAALADLIAQAGRAAAGSPGGAVLGPVTDGTQATVAYAPVAPSGGAPMVDLAVVTVGHAPTGTVAAGGSGVIPAAALAVIAVGGFVLLRAYIVRPVRRLRACALAIAGGDLDTAAGPSAAKEVSRVARAFETCRGLLTKHERPAPRPRGVAALVVVSVAAVAVASWSAGVLTLFANRSTAVPDELVTSLRSQTSRATDALRRSVNDGLADLSALVELHGSEGPDGVRASARQLAERQPRYRSVYLVDRAGAAQDYAGRSPLRMVERPPAKEGIRQQNNSGRVPVIFAHVPLPDGKHTLIGEFDIDHIANLLSRAPGRVRLVDTDFRTISATAGYVAFEKVSDAGLLDSIVLAQRGDTVAGLRDGASGQAVVASAAVFGGETGKLGWTVVAEHPVAELALPANDLRRHAELVALVGVLLAGLLFGWHFFGSIKPLRRVAAAADRLVDGDRDTVIYPQRHDEIGTVASCLEICRQAVAEGADRLGEVRRPRGSATDQTALMVPVAKPDLPRQQPRRPAARSGSGSR